MKRQSGTILLTSTGLSVDRTYSFVKEKGLEVLKNVTIITTAHPDKELGKYVQLAAQQFKELGAKEINFIDIEKESVPSNTTLLYVTGGNTFTLIKWAREKSLKETIEKLLNNNGMYIGVSAGAIILGNTIETALLGEGDKNVENLSNMIAFSIIDADIIVHADDKIEGELSHDTKFKKPLFIRDDDAWVLEYKDEKIINYFKL